MQTRCDGWPLPGTTEERDDRQDQKNDEQDLRYTGRGSRDATKSEYSGNDSHDQENQGVMKHGSVLLNESLLQPVLPYAVIHP
jgi:hypothetical protein